MFKSTFLIAMDDPLRRALSKLEHITHCYLYTADKTKLIPKHTIIYNNGKLTITEGIIGKANRVYKLDAESALEFQRKMQKAIKKDSWIEWIYLARWYLNWKNNVSEIIQY